MEKTQKNSTVALLIFTKECRGSMVLSVLLAVFGALFGIVPYLAAAELIIRMVEGSMTLSHALFFALIALLGYLGSVWLSTFSTMLSHRSAFRILKSIRLALTEKLSRVPMGFIQSKASGKFKTMLVDTVERLELPLAHMIPELTANILIPVFLFCYLFFLDWRMALISLATIPLGLVCYMGMMKDYEARYQRVLDAEKNMDAAVVEYMGGIEVVKTFNQENTSFDRFREAVLENREAKSTWFSQTNGFYAAGMAIMPSTLLTVLPAGAWFYINGTMNASVLITCIILSMGLVKPLISALQYTDSFAMVDATVKEIGGLLREEELHRPKAYVTLPDSLVSFHNVSFGYGEKEVLHDISFTCIPKGLTAIVGPSGSGKSTVARLLASFWEADRGEVRLGGVDVQNIPLEQVMETVSYVSQENFLFHLTVEENIRLGKPDATRKEVEEAAKKASCLDFIQTLPHGFETLVSDGGDSLSGGERQRIAIARALLKDSPVVILDEATAFTDPENEAVIQRSLNELMRGKTVIMIAHRLSTVVGAQKILVLDEGRLQAEGTHEELLKTSPLYLDLWKAHTRYKDQGEEAVPC